MSAVTVDSAVAAVQKASTTPDVTTRDFAAIKIGQVVRQGDLYIVSTDGRRLNKRPLTDLNTNDLSGDGRHVVTGDVRVVASPENFSVKVLTPNDPSDPESAFEVRDASEVVPGVALARGPLVIAKGPISLTHPEHATVNLPKGTYTVVFQTDAATQERAAD